MFQRIKRLIKLSKKDPKALEALTDEQINLIPEVGDGKAEFFGEGTEEEFAKAIVHPVESNISKLSALAHRNVTNSGSLEEFFLKIRGIALDNSETEGNVACQ